MRPTRTLLSAIAVILLGTGAAPGSNLANFRGAEGTDAHVARASTSMTVAPPASVVARPVATPTPPERPASAAAASMLVHQLLAQINGLRARHGLAPYSLLSGLIASAHKHNLRMIAGCGLSHRCPGEASVGHRITAEGVHWRSWAENIGWSGPYPNTTAAKLSAAEGLTTLMYNERPPNDGHRLNLLSPKLHHIGIDVVRTTAGRVWLTQDFTG